MLENVHDLVPPGAGEVPDELFRRIVDRTALPFVIVDHAGQVHYASGSVAELLGWRAPDVVGRNMIEFVVPAQAELAVAALGEIESVRADIGVPMVFELLRPDGETRWVEVAAMPLFDGPGVELIALRLRPWSAERHLADFITVLLADEPLSRSLVPLSRSIAASVEATRVAVLHGWNGTTFEGAAGSWDGAADLGRDAGPWCDLALTPPEDPFQVGCDDGDEVVWLIRVDGSETVPPAVIAAWPVLAEPALLGHRQALEQAAGYVRLALIRTAEHQRLRHLADHDSLTGMANRASFRDRLAHVLATSEPRLGVAFCDLDGFKPVNDEHGHQAGDAVLVEVAARLRSALRSGDELARIGGDEFTVLLHDVPSTADAEARIQQLLAALDEPVAVPNGTAHVGMSVGVALAQPGMVAEELLARADRALYESKRLGGGRGTIVG